MHTGVGLCISLWKVLVPLIPLFSFVFPRKTLELFSWHFCFETLFFTIDESHLLSYQVFPTWGVFHWKVNLMVLAQSYRVTFVCCLFVPILLEMVCIFFSSNVCVVFTCHPWKTHYRVTQSRTDSLSTMVNTHLIFWLNVTGYLGQPLFGVSCWWRPRAAGVSFQIKSWCQTAVSWSAGVLCATYDAFFLVAFAEHLKCESIFLVWKFCVRDRSTCEPVWGL